MMRNKIIGQKDIQTKIEALSEEQVDELTDRSNKMMKEFMQAVEQGLEPGSKKAQRLIRYNYDMMAEFHVLTKEMFLRVWDSVMDQKGYYAAYHPKLPEFLYKAMDAFATEFYQD